MHDLARLGVDRGVILGRLQPRELAQRGAGEILAEQERLQARDDRVASEHGHEPRQPGGDQLPVAAGPQPQRGEIVDRPVVRALRAAARSSSASARVCRQVRRDASTRRPSAGSATTAVSASAASSPGATLQVELPLAVWSERRRGSRGRVPCACLGCEEVTSVTRSDDRVGEAQAETLGVVLGREPGPGSGSLSAAAPEAEIVRLDGEDVGEVGLQLQLDVELDRRARGGCGRRVAPRARRRSVVSARSPARPARSPPASGLRLTVGGRVWISSPPGQERGPGAVDEQDEARQEASVVGKEPGRWDVDVAALVDDAERGSGENRLRHGARAYPEAVGFTPRRVIYGTGSTEWNFPQARATGAARASRSSRRPRRRPPRAARRALRRRRPRR